MKIKRILTVCVLAVAILSLAGCGANEKSEVKEAEAEAQIAQSIYSWNKELWDNPDTIDELSSYELTRLYQGLYPSDLQSEETVTLVKNMAAKDIDVAYLSGDKSWSDSNTVIDWSIKLLEDYNSGIGSSAKIDTICYDCEIYGEEGHDTEEYFRAFVDMMKPVIVYAHNIDVKVIMVLPYWLAETSEECFREIATLVDEISCPVFFVGEELNKIQLPYNICKETGCKLELVLETQPPNDTWGVTEYNTYWVKGKDSMMEVVSSIKETYPNIGIGYHELMTLLELQ